MTQNNERADEEQEQNTNENGILVARKSFHRFPFRQMILDLHTIFPQSPHHLLLYIFNPTLKISFSLRCEHEKSLDWKQSSSWNIHYTI